MQAMMHGFDPLRQRVEELLADRRFEDVYDLLTDEAPGDASLERCVVALEERLLGKYMRAARPHAVARVVAAPDDLAWLTIDDEDRALAARIDGASTFEMIAESSASGRFAAYRSLHRLVRAKVVAAVTPTSDRTALLPMRLRGAADRAPPVAPRWRPLLEAALLVVAIALASAAVHVAALRSISSWTAASR
jgi:hypothetical protein